MLAIYVDAGLSFNTSPISSGIRWIKEFVPNLQHRQKRFDVERNLKIDDIVMATENLQQRLKWLMGRVLKTFSD